MISDILYQKTNFDKTVEFYFECFERKGLFKLFPRLKEDLTRQHILINNEPELDNFDLYQEFKQIINGLNGDYYEVSWLISKIEKYFESIDAIPTKTKISYLNIDLNEIDEFKLDSLSSLESSNLKPIFVFDYLPSGYKYVIDGNHRIYLAKQRGEKYIDAYWLTQDSIFEFMNNRSQNLYTFHHNLAVLYTFCKSPFSDWAIKKSKKLEWGTYYSTNDKLNVSIGLKTKLKVLFSQLKIT